MTVNYSYDALGRRIERTSSTTGTERFVYDGDDVVRDLDGNGSTSADYLNGAGIDNKLRQTIAGAASYFILDHLGTTRGFTDSSGNSSSSVSYDSFGNVIGGSLVRYTFTGREADPGTGLMYYRARWYDSQQGRFLTEDPIQLSGGLNLYAYVRNYPVGLKDPFGLQQAAPAPAPAAPPLAPPAPSIPLPAAGAGAGAATEVGVAAGGSAGAGAAATGGVVIGGLAAGWVIGRVIGHIPTGGGKTVDDRVQDWMIDHIWGRPDPGPRTTPTPKEEPKCDDDEKKKHCEENFQRCLMTSLADKPGSLSGEKRCVSCWKICTGSGAWPSRYPTTRGFHSCEYGKYQRAR